MCATLVCVCVHLYVCVHVPSLYIPEYTSLCMCTYVHSWPCSRVSLVRVCACTGACLYLWSPACTCACLGGNVPTLEKILLEVALVPGSQEPSSSGLSLSSQTSCGAWKGTRVPPWHSRPQAGLNLPPHGTPRLPCPTDSVLPTSPDLYAAPTLLTVCSPGASPTFEGCILSLTPMVPFKDNVCPHFAVGDTEVSERQNDWPKSFRQLSETVARL